MNRFLLSVGLLLLTGEACQKKTVDPTTGCQLTATIDNETWTYQFGLDGRVSHIARHTLNNNLDYTYAYQGQQATIDITDPQLGPTGLRFHYELTLNEQGYVLTAKETMSNTRANGTLDQSLIDSHTCTYDAQGYLTTHHVDHYTYPLGGSPHLSETADAQISYQDGNPVTITYVANQDNRLKSASITTSQYSTQLNPVKLAFLLEANPFGYSPDQALQPLLGKIPRTLITTSALTGTIRMTTNYTYRTNASGQLTQADRASSPGISAPFNFSFDTTCP